MADEGYNTHAAIRAATGMGAAIPTEAIITQWVDLIDGVIERYDSAPNTSAAKAIEMNRISTLYATLKQGANPNTLTVEQRTLIFAPLTTDEKSLISGYDGGVDSLSINGKRKSEQFGGRR